MKDYLNDVLIKMLLKNKKNNFYTIRRKLNRYGFDLDKIVLLKRIRIVLKETK